MSPDAAPDAPGSVTVVLHRTRSPVNAGAAVRASANFGLTRIILCDPAGFDLAHARRVAASAALVLDEASVSPSLDETLDQFTRIVATTARIRHDDRAAGPTEAARYIQQAVAEGEQVALLFGNESSGLPAGAIARAHLVSRVPTDPAAPSINLAQAVLLHGWELARLAGADEGESRIEALPRPSGTEAPLDPETLARLRKEAHDLLLEIGFLDPNSPERVLSELERLLLHGHPTKREGGMLLSLLRRLQWRVQAR